ncbi:hypothetical protein DL93DRAFT_2222962 [Clavulina sp. PMI_390]|nr:hypothetical protein DL93DRAFT_2222962 [Clavulina sp. PMI_390]
MLRNSTRMNTLLNAETGGTMVRLDASSGIQEGSPIAGVQIDAPRSNNRNALKSSQTAPELKRISSSSLLNPHSQTSYSNIDGPEATANNDTTLNLNLASLTSSSATSFLRNSSQPVGLDLILENQTAVEGSSLNGLITIKATQTSDSSALLVGPAKIRVLGFEAIPHGRHTFYQHSVPLGSVAPSLDSIFVTHGDSTRPPCPNGNTAEYRRLKPGRQSIPFSFILPKKRGAKGSVISLSRVHVRYIILISFRYCLFTKDDSMLRNSPAPQGGKYGKHIAHFYRPCHIFPSYDPLFTLSPLLRPVTRTASKSLFLGGEGKLKLLASLHRTTWVAGQQCWLTIRLHNDTTYRVRSLTLALYRVTTTFRIDPRLNPGGQGRGIEVDIDSCEAAATRKKLGEVALESGGKAARGAVTGKGWWCGVDAKAATSVVYGIPLPLDALTISRSRLLEINYFICVTANTGSLTADVHVELPINIINFISLFPPPAGPSAALVQPQIPSMRYPELPYMSPLQPNSQHFHGRNASSQSIVNNLSGSDVQIYEDDQNHDLARLSDRPSRADVKSRRMSLPETHQSRPNLSRNSSRNGYQAPGNLGNDEDSDVEEIDEILQSAHVREAEVGLVWNGPSQSSALGQPGLSFEDEGEDTMGNAFPLSANALSAGTLMHKRSKSELDPNWTIKAQDGRDYHSPHLPSVPIQKDHRLSPKPVSAVQDSKSAGVHGARPVPGGPRALPVREGARPKLPSAFLYTAETSINGHKSSTTSENAANAAVRTRVEEEELGTATQSFAGSISSSRVSRVREADDGTGAGGSFVPSTEDLRGLGFRVDPVVRRSKLLLAGVIGSGRHPTELSPDSAPASSAHSAPAPHSASTSNEHNQRKDNEENKQTSRNAIDAATGETPDNESTNVPITKTRGSSSRRLLGLAPTTSIKARIAELEKAGLNRV